VKSEAGRARLEQHASSARSNNLHISCSHLVEESLTAAVEGDFDRSTGSSKQ